MTFSETRSAIATALSTVTGVHGFTIRPVSVNVGDAWPVLSSIERDGVAFGATWIVVVVLERDERSAFSLIDSLAGPLADALEDLVTVDRITPTRMSVSAEQTAGDLYTLEITCRS